MIDTKKAAEAALETQHKNNDSSGIFQGIQAVSLDISADSLEPLELPIDGFSDDIQQIINEYTETLKCNRSYIVASMFAAVSAAVGSRCFVNYGLYNNYIQFWFGLIGRSGANKSAPISAMLQPIHDREELEEKIYLEKYKKYQVLMDLGDKTAEEPIQREFILDDSTPEGRSKVLHANKAALLVSDEIATMFGNFGRYNPSGEETQMLTLWDGRPVKITRKGEPPKKIRANFSIIGGMQPGIIGEYFGKKERVVNGFGGRWLFVYPETTPPRYLDGKNLSPEIKERWERIINSLLDFDFENNYPEKGRLDLSNPTTHSLYKVYNDSLEDKLLAEPGVFLSSIYSKLKISVLRIAGAIHLLGDNYEMSKILPEEMLFATRICEYFEETAKKVSSMLNFSDVKQRVQVMSTKQEVLAAILVSFPNVNKSACAKALGIAHTNFAKQGVKDKVSQMEEFLNSSEHQQSE